MRKTAPIRQTVERTCPICSDKLCPDERAICETCRCYSKIPRILNYQQRERYWECITSKDNPMRVATHLPKTGIPYLDANKINYWELLLNDVTLIEWRYEESQQGLDNTELANAAFPLR